MKNQKSLQALEARMKQQQPSGDLRSIASKRLLSQLMAAEKADTERASLRKDLKARKTLTSKETEVEESRQEQMALEAIAMQEQQQRQQRLQDDRIQAEQQAKANAYAILQQQEQAEQQEAMAQAEAKAVAEQEEQRRQLLQEEQQRQQEWQKYLRGKMVEEKKREEALYAEHQQEQEHLRAELAAEEQKHITILKEEHRQRLQLLEQRSEQQQHELFQAEQQTQLQLQQRLEATNNLQQLPPLDLSEEEALTPVAKRPRPYAALRGAYMPPNPWSLLPSHKQRWQGHTSLPFPRSQLPPPARHRKLLPRSPSHLDASNMEVVCFCSPLPSLALESQLLFHHGRLLQLQQHLPFPALWNRRPRSSHWKR